MQPRIVTEKEWAFTVFGLAVLFGVFVRILPALVTDFPINDGGMFAVMMRDLRVNNFLLPAYTTYNSSDIPFAYPPLGFYIGAILQTFGINELQVLTWVPVIFASLTIPCFYFLTFELTESRSRATLATVFFSLAPGNYVWLLMGGGLTRALGTFFLILSIYFVHRAYKESNWKITIFAVIFCSLTVLSHPQTALIAAISSFIFLLFSIRSGSAVLHASAVAVGTLLFTSIWWGNVISQHGFDIFLSASQSGDLRASFSELVENLFSIQTTFPFGTFFRIFGLTWVIYKRRFDLLVWGFSFYLIDQRSASILTSLLFPILSAFGFADVLPAFVHWLRKREWAIQSDGWLFNQRTLSLGLLGVIFYLLIECSFHAYVIRNLALLEESRQMMTWIKKNTPNESSFLILTGRIDVMTDPAQEWFPALAKRHSETTLQGLEWILQTEFMERRLRLAELQACQNLECVDMISQAMNLEFTYIVIDKLRFNFILEESNLLFENDRYAVIRLK